jgi:hypothetical protein
MILPEISALFTNIGSFLTPVLQVVWETIKMLWWLPLPFILWLPFKFLYLWWRNEYWLSKEFRPVILEIKIPKDSLKPIRAMEAVMASIHSAITQPPDLWEKWIDGQVQTSVAFEVASLGGEIHFFVRFNFPYRDAVEASIYSQYPEAEITQVDDYTKYVPRDIPNKDWDLFGCEYKLARDEHFPIKTYTDFETEQESEEEKRIDPMASLMEALAKVKPGEQFWFQFLCSPKSDANADKGFLWGIGKMAPEMDKWLKDGEKIRDILAHRTKEAAKLPSMPAEAAHILLTGAPTPVEEATQDFLPPEMKLTPGEKEVLAGLEKKMSKPVFNTTVRFIYLGRREVWFKSNFRLAFAFFSEYATANLNQLLPNAKTLTKIKKSYFLLPNRWRPRRLYLRQRTLFKHYLERLTSFYPRQGGQVALNIEEMASLYHFPSWAVSPVPGAQRVEAKKGPAPELPTE